MIRDSRFRSLNHVRRGAANAMKSLPLSAALRTWPDLLLARPSRQRPKAFIAGLKSRALLRDLTHPQAGKCVSHNRNMNSTGVRAATRRASRLRAFILAQM